MACLRPFAGIRYDPGRVGRLWDIICPPYDIISLEQQRSLHDLSPYNLVRLEYGLELPGDSRTENKYSRASATLLKWLEQGVLKAEAKPALYLHRHFFTYGGRSYHRWGLLAPLRLRDWGQEVRPHEYTMAAPKRDRLSLMHACRANLSPVFGLYPDPANTVASLLARVESEPPTVEAAGDFQGDRHLLWVISGADMVERIVAGLRGQSIYIADGHHRYETALAYKREQLQKHPESGGDEAFNFVLINLVAFKDPGLLIMPQHRLLRGIAPGSLDGLKEVISRFFESDELPADAPLPAGDGVIGVVGLGPKRLLVLRRREDVSLEKTSLQDRSPAYRSLGVSLLENLILDGWLGPRDESGVDIAYTPDGDMVRHRVAQGEHQLAFLLNPISAGSIRLVADSGERLPRKSTYFYPKPPSGLVIHSLKD